MQRGYFHFATWGSVGGTGVTPSSSALSVAYNVDGTSGILRSMSDTRGTTQTSASVASLAQTSIQAILMVRVMSQRIAAGTYTVPASMFVTCAASESNTNAHMGLNWRLWFWDTSPASTGIIGSVMSSSGSTGVGLTSEFALTLAAASAAQTVTVTDTTIIVLDVYSVQTQTMGTSYTDNFFYDGTTDGSNTSNAAYIDFGIDIPLAVAAAAPEQRVISQAVQRAASRCWARRPSGIVVPKLWTPEPALGAVI